MNNFAPPSRGRAIYCEEKQNYWDLGAIGGKSDPEEIFHYLQMPCGENIGRRECQARVCHHEKLGGLFIRWSHSCFVQTSTNYTVRKERASVLVYQFQSTSMFKDGVSVNI